jgi:hypothetical protein
MRYLVIAIALLLVIAACTSAPATPKPATADDVLANTANTGGTGPAEDATPPGTKTDDSANKLKDIFAKNVKFAVTYDVKTAGTQNEMTQYITDGKMRTDITTQGMEVRSYLIGDEYTSCNKATGDWMCQKITYEPSSADTAKDDIKKNPEQYAIESLPGRTIARAATDCFRITTKNGVVEYCYSNEGVPLYMKTTAGAATSELIAKEYSTTVPADSFDLPAEPGEAIDPSKYLENLPG